MRIEDEESCECDFQEKTAGVVESEIEARSRVLLVQLYVWSTRHGRCEKIFPENTLSVGRVTIHNYSDLGFDSHNWR